MRALIISILWFSMLAGCSFFDYDKSVLSHANDYNWSLKIELVIDSVLIVPIGDDQLSFHQFRQVRELNGELYYFGFDPKRPKGIEWHNLNTKISGVINFEHPNLQTLGPFFVHSFDSIFFTNEIPPRLWIGNNQGHLVDPIFLDNAPISWDVNEYYFESLTSWHLPYYDKGKVYLQLSPLDYWDRDKNVYRFFISYDLFSKSYGINYGEAHGIYNSSRVEYPYQYSSAYSLIKGDTTIVSFPLDHNLYLYNNKNGNLISERECGSQFLRKLSDPVENGNLGAQEAMDFFNSAGFYQELHYHSKLKLYSRVVTHEKPLLDASGRITSECLREYSIQWFDEDLDLIYETMVDNSLVRFLKSSTPTPYGYLAFAPCGIPQSENILTENIFLTIKINY